MQSTAYKEPYGHPLIPQPKTRNLDYGLRSQERREKLAETVAATSELREWRWKQAQGLKQLAAKPLDLCSRQAQAAKVLDLKESKEFVEFKRETKLRTRLLSGGSFFLVVE
eukprot:s4115_g3.t2